MRMPKVLRGPPGPAVGRLPRHLWWDEVSILRASSERGKMLWKSVLLGTTGSLALPGGRVRADRHYGACGRDFGRGANARIS